MPFDTTSSLTGSWESDVKKVVIQKPRQLKDNCSLRVESERLPLIGEKIKKVKRKTAPKKVEKSSLESLQYWLKPGVSLPKLQSKNIGVPDVEDVLSKSSSKIVPCSEEVAFDNPVLDHCCNTSLIFSSERTSNNGKPTDSDSEEYRDVTGASKCQFSFKVPLEDVKYYVGNPSYFTNVKSKK